MPAGRGARDLRLLSWNVRSLRDDAAAVVGVLRLLEPDVVCLQEAPRFLRWRWRLAELARRGGLVYTCGGRTTGGPALLTALRVDVRGVHEWRLSRTPGQFVRGAACAELTVGGAPLFVASVHLGLTAAERERHAGELLARLGGAGKGPIVVAGDLNETEAGPAWRALVAGGLRDAHLLAPIGRPATFPARSPRRRIDAILASAGIEVLSAGVPDVDPALLSRATDHLPVLADLEIPAA